MSRASACARVVTVMLCASGCVSPLDRGEQLYRQGALPEAVATWRSIPPGSPERVRAEQRVEIVASELERRRRRFEKQAAFYEADGRLGEAVLYYRLTVEMDPRQTEILERVQQLVRQLKREREAERERMRSALAAGDLIAAGRSAEKLAYLDPFDPTAVLETREVQEAISGEVERRVDLGRRAWQQGDHRAARSAFRSAQQLDADNQEALGYLGYIGRQQGDVTRQEILAEGHFRAGRRAAEQGELFRALEQLDEALQFNPKHTGARRDLAALRRDLGPQVDTLYAQGRQYFQEDDLPNALRSWERLLLIEPGHARAAENAERTRRILDRLEEIESGGS